MRSRHPTESASEPSRNEGQPVNGPDDEIPSLTKRFLASGVQYTLVLIAILTGLNVYQMIKVEQNVSAYRERLSYMIRCGDPRGASSEVVGPEYNGQICQEEILEHYSLSYGIVPFCRRQNGHLDFDGRVCFLRIDMNEIFDYQSRSFFCERPPVDSDSFLSPQVEIILTEPLRIYSAGDPNDPDKSPTTRSPVYAFHWRILGTEQCRIHARGHSVAGGLSFLQYEQHLGESVKAREVIHYIYSRTWDLVAKRNSDSYRWPLPLYFRPIPCIQHPEDR